MRMLMQCGSGPQGCNCLSMACLAVALSMIIDYRATTYTGLETD